MATLKCSVTTSNRYSNKDVELMSEIDGLMHHIAAAVIASTRKEHELSRPPGTLFYKVDISFSLTPVE